MSLLIRAVIVAAIVAVCAVPGTASALTPGPSDDTYSVGEWLCAPMPGDDMCVHNPDPEGFPVSVEPDNDWRPLREVMAATLLSPPPSLSDGNSNGPSEDDPAFDCRWHGNGVCGPNNSNGHPAGCYKRTGADRGALIRPWGPDMAADRHYRPDGCGIRTARDKAMDDRLNGGMGWLCAGMDTATRVCWTVDNPRPKEANGTAYRP